jgi:hypothetical protein
MGRSHSVCLPSLVLTGAPLSAMTVYIRCQTIKPASCQPPPFYKETPSLVPCNCLTYEMLIPATLSNTGQDLEKVETEALAVPQPTTSHCRQLHARPSHSHACTTFAIFPLSSFAAEEQTTHTDCSTPQQYAIKIITAGDQRA